MKEIKSFTDWWALNKEEYEKIGVSRITARSIWNDACDVLQKEIIKTLKL